MKDIIQRIRYFFSTPLQVLAVILLFLTVFVVVLGSFVAGCSPEVIQKIKVIFKTSRENNL